MSPNRVAASLVVLLMLSAGACAQTGTLEGTVGGNERDITVYQRGKGTIVYEIIYGTGDFKLKDLPVGEYMVMSTGRIAPRVPVREGKTTTVRFGPESYFQMPCTTWSPPRVSFGQTFEARANRIDQLDFWIPAGEHMLSVTLREKGPKGRVVGEYKHHKPAGWFFMEPFDADRFPTEVGKKYYLELRNVEGKTWQMGMPGAGDVYPHGEAYFDGEMQLDCDLAFTIHSDVSGLEKIAGAYDGLGFIKEGPGSGLCKEAGQTFIATTPNIISALIQAGWGAKPELVLKFDFSVHEEGPGGKQIGPTLRAPMVTDWGQTALWFPDDIKVTPGKRYYISARRADGDPFYAYLSRDTYAGGCAWRDGKPLENFDSIFTVRGEREPDSITYPFNVVVEPGETNVAVTWETGTPTDSRAVVTEIDVGEIAGAWNAEAVRGHRLEVSGLKPGTKYEIVVLSKTRREDAMPVRSRPEPFTTKGEAPAAPPKPLVSENIPRGKPLPMTNSGFEEDLEGWKYAGNLGKVSEQIGHHAPPQGKKMFGYVITPGPGEKPDKLPEAERGTVLREVEVVPGRTYLLSALVYTRDVPTGSAQHNNRVALIACSPEDSAQDLVGAVEGDGALRGAHMTQYYATSGKWHRYHLRFKAKGSRAAIGFEMMRWYRMTEDDAWVDDVRLEELP